MTKPSTPLFGWTTATANRESPTAGAQVSGFRAGAPIPSRILNGLLGNARDWLSWLIGAFRLTEDAGALETWIPDVDQSVVVPTSPASTSVVVQDVGAAYIAGTLVEPSTTGDITVAIPTPGGAGAKQWHAIVMDAGGNLQVLSLTQYTTPDPAPAFPGTLVNRATQMEIAWVRTFEGQTEIEEIDIVDRRQTRPLTSASVERSGIAQDRLAMPPVYIHVEDPPVATTVNGGTEWEWAIPYAWLYLDGSGAPELDLGNRLAADGDDYLIRVELLALVTASSRGTEVRCGPAEASGLKLYVRGDAPSTVFDWPTSPPGGNPAVVRPTLSVANPGDPRDEWVITQETITVRAPQGETTPGPYILRVTPIGPKLMGVQRDHYLTLTTP